MMNSGSALGYNDGLWLTLYVVLWFVGLFAYGMIWGGSAGSVGDAAAGMRSVRIKNGTTAGAWLGGWRAICWSFFPFFVVMLIASAVSGGGDDTWTRSLQLLTGARESPKASHRSRTPTRWPQIRQPKRSGGTCPTSTASVRMRGRNWLVRRVERRLEPELGQLRYVASSRRIFWKALIPPCLVVASPSGPLPNSSAQFAPPGRPGTSTIRYCSSPQASSPACCCGGA